MWSDVAGAQPQTEKVPEHSKTQSKADRGGAPLAGRRAKADAQKRHVRPDSKATPHAGWFARLARLEEGRAIEYGDIKYNVGYISPLSGANITSLYIMFNINNRFSTNTQRARTGHTDTQYRNGRPCRPSRPQGLTGIGARGGRLPPAPAMKPQPGNAGR